MDDKSKLTDLEKDHLHAALLFSELCRIALVDYLLMNMVSPNERVEEWALNGLRSYGEIRFKYKDSGLNKDVSEFVSKIVDFYFKSVENNNGR